MSNLDFRKYLKLLLYLVALHSFLVGLGLIIMPSAFIESLGYYPCGERFFRAQGGVFHIAMAVGYAMAGFNSRRFQCLVIFSIIVKIVATLFLFSYFVFVNQLLILLLSLISDFLMGVFIWVLYYYSNKEAGTE
ncbi:MAG: hypothetical protein RBR95_02530 [Ignavibacteriaceae bacterium]|jgi:hypothetical protein|nr:hypothetical protein [Ignavibacteriaceae bacterium]HPO54468.1 hypothetical protein [Ignavibacteriaceae bacterium]